MTRDIKKRSLFVERGINLCCPLNRTHQPINLGFVGRISVRSYKRHNATMPLVLCLIGLCLCFRKKIWRKWLKNIYFYRINPLYHIHNICFKGCLIIFGGFNKIIEFLTIITIKNPLKYTFCPRDMLLFKAICKKKCLEVIHTTSH